MQVLNDTDYRIQYISGKTNGDADLLSHSSMEEKQIKLQDQKLFSTKNSLIITKDTL
jgi:hypothetical protein